MSLVLGVDYGTDSVRAVVIDATDGGELGAGTFAYPRWEDGVYCDPTSSQFRQHPKDYLEGLEHSIRAALANSPTGTAERVVAIGVDMTGSTPALVDRDGTPLAMHPEFADDPDAMFVLWKDHTAIAEADDINALCRAWTTDYTCYSGGTYSSEWFWAKLLHLLRTNATLRDAAFSFVECSDWVPAVLTGDPNPLNLKRNRCAAGHKAMWHADWGGLPPQAFLTALDPLLDGWTDRLFTETHPADVAAGRLCDEWAGRLGLSTEVIVTCGAIDAHMGAVGGGVKTGTLLKVVGTSTCDMAVVEPQVMGDRLVDGICGQVDGSIVPGLVGVEAGQSAFGDVYAWFKSLLSWPIEQADFDSDVAASLTDSILMKLETKALEIPADESSVLALDWFNGRRTPHANPSVKAGLAGLTLGTDAPMIYKALIEATCFGSKRINDCMADQGIEINDVVCVGGVAKKSKLVMQTMADVLNMPVKVSASEQGCALGCAMAAATAAGIYDSVGDAQTVMAGGISAEYKPIPGNVAAYESKYEDYLKLGMFAEGKE